MQMLRVILTCLDRVDLAHPFWVLVTFPVTFSVLVSWEIRSKTGKKWSSRIRRNIQHPKENIVMAA